MAFILWHLRFSVKYNLWFTFGKYLINILCMLEEKVNYLPWENTPFYAIHWKNCGFSKKLT